MNTLANGMRVAFQSQLTARGPCLKHQTHNFTQKVGVFGRDGAGLRDRAAAFPQANRMPGDLRRYDHDGRFLQGLLIHACPSDGERIKGSATTMKRVG